MDGGQVFFSTTPEEFLGVLSSQVISCACSDFSVDHFARYLFVCFLISPPSHLVHCGIDDDGWSFFHLLNFSPLVNFTTSTRFLLLLFVLYILTSQIQPSLWNIVEQASLSMEQGSSGAMELPRWSHAHARLIRGCQQKTNTSCHLNKELELPHPLCHLLFDGLICVHDSLFVDDDLGCISSWSTDA